MKYKAKSIIIGRKKRPNKEQEDYPCFINLFTMNDPHKSGKVPEKMLDFPKIHKVMIRGLDVNYLLPGNDIVINNLKSVDIEVDEPHIIVTGSQTAE
jgi:hypothetical protein